MIAVESAENGSVEPSLWTPEQAVPDHIKTLLVPTSDKQEINYALAFINIVRLLKTQKRTGWVDRGIDPSKVESIGDHMYRMSVIAMLVPNQKIDTGKCANIAIIHDIAESLVGDIPPYANVTKEEKHRREYETIKYLSALIKPYNEQFSEKIVELWLDYEEIRTLEARYVKDIDKLEMVQQAWEYERDFDLKFDLGEFYEARSSIVSKEIGDLCDGIIAQRTAFVASRKP